MPEEQNEPAIKFDVELETNNKLMHCVVKGEAYAKTKERPDGSIEVELKTNQLLTQPRSSCLCPKSLGPLSLVARSKNAEDNSIESKVKIKTPKLLTLVSELQITNDVKISTPQPISEVVKEIFQPEKEPVSTTSQWRAKAAIRPPKLPLIPETFYRDLTVTTPKAGDPLHRKSFTLKTEGDLFEGLPLPYTTMNAQFTRKDTVASSGLFAPKNVDKESEIPIESKQFYI